MAATNPPPSSTPAKKSTEKKSPGGNSSEDKKRIKPKDYIHHWKGYLFIFLSSLINLSSASNSASAFNYHGGWQVAISFGSVTFALCFLILLFDRTKWLSDKLGDYSKAYEGKLEGGVLVAFVVWWVVGVSYQTQVDGIAYMANNVYFSSWLTLALCIYTLNEWSTEKDILSIEELTSISETLASWYMLLLGSLVVTGTSIQLWLEVHEDLRSESALGISLGAGSFVVCGFWILVHYNFIEVVKEGGWLELCSSFLSVLLWIVGCAVLTQEGAIGATLVGDGCRHNGVMAITAGNCTVTFVNDRGGLETLECDDVTRQFIPGSNLYAGVWLCLGASLNIAFKWKQQQAQNFAHAQNVRTTPEKKPELAERQSSKNDDDDDDLDDFQDVDVF
ncbi:hypothetical protein ACA910_016665 [Epithemia clementina (nom. ined.)]